MFRATNDMNFDDNGTIIEKYLNKLKNSNRDSYDANGFEVGDIIDGSFVYTSKQAHFYLVVRRTAKMIEMAPLEKKVVSDDGYGQNGTCVPTENKSSERLIKARINKGGYLKIDKWTTGKLWNGKPVDFYTD